MCAQYKECMCVLMPNGSNTKCENVLVSFRRTVTFIKMEVLVLYLLQEQLPGNIALYYN